MREIIDEGKLKADAEIGKAKSVLHSVNKPVQQFTADTNYELAKGEIISLTFGANNDTLYAIKEKLDVSLDKEIATLKVSNLIRENLKQGSSTYIKKVAADLNKLSTHPGAQYIHEMSMENGQMVLTAEVEERIRESFRTVITTEAGLKLLELQTAAAKALTDIFYFINDHTIMHYAMPHQMVIQVFGLDLEGKKIVPNLLNYDQVIKSNKQKSVGVHN